MQSADPLLPPRKIADSRSEMTELILPNDANTLGNLLGGRLMHYIDLVGAMCAYRHSRTHVVTASMDHIDFHRPGPCGRFTDIEVFAQPGFPYFDGSGSEGLGGAHHRWKLSPRGIGLS